MDASGQISSQTNFIVDIVNEDLRNKKFDSVTTRFPPEPNGYLHIGHLKSIYLNFMLAKDYNGKCNLRFDDTNPVTEDTDYIESIKQDINWLGFHWTGDIKYTSNYFKQLYDWAIELIKNDLAYVDDQSESEVRLNRGSLIEPGKNSIFRNRSVEKNLELFEKMKNGEFEEGKCILRAKIDMSHSNINMRDPILYRIRFKKHLMVGKDWCIYPTYDFSHGQSDSIEKITHSLCSLEFLNHRILYDWFQEKLGIFKTQQIEFARFQLTYCLMSKRKLRYLVEQKFVDGWDDPRMPTISGCRRRGFPADALKAFIASIGVAKRENLIEIDKMYHFVRESLSSSPKKLGVVDLLPITLINRSVYDKNYVEIENIIEDKATKIEHYFDDRIYIDRKDFSLSPPEGWKRLKPNGLVKLRNLFVIKCEEFINNEQGETIELKCSIQLNEDFKKQKCGIIHWISDQDSVDAEFRIYDKLFTLSNMENLEKDQDWVKYINPQCLIVKKGKVDKSLKTANTGFTFQLERTGYFCVDKYSSSESLIINRVLELPDKYNDNLNANNLNSIKKIHDQIARREAAIKRQQLKEARLARNKQKANIDNVN